MKVASVWILLATLATPGAAFDPGPAVGESAPAIEGLDQNETRRTFEDLRGENGLYVVFYRSADW